MWAAEGLSRLMRMASCALGSRRASGSCCMPTEPSLPLPSPPSLCSDACRTLFDLHPGISDSFLIDLTMTAAPFCARTGILNALYYPLPPHTLISSHLILTVFVRLIVRAISLSSLVSDLIFVLLTCGCVLLYLYRLCFGFLVGVVEALRFLSVTYCVLTSV